MHKEIVVLMVERKKNGYLKEKVYMESLLESNRNAERNVLKSKMFLVFTAGCAIEIRIYDQRFFFFEGKKNRK